MSVQQRLLPSLAWIAALAAWIAVAILFTTVSPTGSPSAQLLAAVLLGTAVGFSVWPLLHRLGARARAGGDWTTSGRRAAIVGLALAMLVLLRALDAFSLPVGLFVVVLAVLVEAAFALRR